MNPALQPDIKHTRDGVDLKILKRSTDFEIKEAENQARYLGSRLDLGEYVRKIVFKRYDGEVMSAFSEVNDSMRRRAGESANGTWFPLVALLQRDLNTTNSASVQMANVHSNADVSLMPLSAIMGAGAIVLSGLSGSAVGLPYVENGVDANTAWRHENEGFADAEPDFGLSSLVPKSIDVSLLISHRLLQNTQVNLDALLRTELRRRIGAAIDYAALLGDGDRAPLGLLAQPGLDVYALGANGANVTFGDLTEMEFRVQSPLPVNGSLSWVLGPKLAKKLRNTERSPGVSLLDGLQMLGYDTRISTNAPEDLTKGATAGMCSSLILGDFSEMYIGFWGPAAIDLMVDPVTQAYQGKVRMVARCQVGIVPRRIGAFCAIKDALTF